VDQQEAHNRRVAQFPDDIRGAHPHCFGNRDEVLVSSVCGCFYCCATFSSSDIEEWTDSSRGSQTTALCPRCGMDTVIGDKAGYQLSTAFLEEMKLVWFAPSSSGPPPV
jgi:hypothetical protein